MARTKTTQKSKPRSATLSLPRELRDHIYKYLLTTTFLVETRFARDISSSLPLRPHTRLAILNVSRSTHEEAKRVLYKHGIFRFDAFSADAPPLHEEIGNVPAVTLLQDITLHFDTGTAFSIGHNWMGVVRSATMLINHFAKLDPSARRTRIVVEVIAVFAAEAFLEPSKTAGDFKDALGHLAGFQTVEVKIGHVKMKRLECMVPLYKALDEKLAMTLGNGEGGYEEGRFCLVYHP
ncbi:MAG: hypothetical protein Q9175_007853 [Cornicularia normoerica]